VPFAFFPVTSFLDEFRARRNARVDLGALNAGRAWILGGRVVDGFGQSFVLQFFLGLCFEGFSFYHLLRFANKCGYRPENTSNFYNLINISQTGLGNGCSLIGQIAPIAAGDAILRSLFPLR